MNLIRPLAAVFAVLCIVPPAHAQAQADPQQQMQRIRIPFGSHVPRSTGHEQTYAATCGDVAYRLVVAHASKSVVLKANTLNDVDLSNTLLARQLLDRDTINRVEFNCPMNALNIFLHGFITEYDGMPKAYRVLAGVSHDGTVHVDEALRIEPLDAFGTPPDLKQKAAPAKH